MRYERFLGPSSTGIMCLARKAERSRIRHRVPFPTFLCDLADAHGDLRRSQVGEPNSVQQGFFYSARPD